MTEHENVLADIAARLNAAKIGYMVIGGVAAIAWGVRRGTFDIDITVAMPRENVAGLLAILAGKVEALPEDPVAFAGETGVVPAKHASGMRVDLVLGTVAFARDAIARAVPIEIRGISVNFCTPEDLILHKIISRWERDRSDVQALIRIRRDTLDRDYLDPRVHELGTQLEDPSIEERYRFLFTSD